MVVVFGFSSSLSCEFFQTVFFWTLIARGLSELVYQEDQKIAAEKATKEAIDAIDGAGPKALAAAKEAARSAVSVAATVAGFGPLHRARSLMTPTAAQLSALESGTDLSLSHEQEKQIKQAFDLFDTDGDNKLNMHELAAAMVALGFDSEEAAQRRLHHKSFRLPKQKSEAGAGHSNQNHSLLRLVAAVDKDGSEYIELDEFRTLMEGGLTCRDSSYEIHRVFCKLVGDSEKDSSMQPAHGITADMLAQACKSLQVRLEPEEIEKLMKVSIEF